MTEEDTLKIKELEKRRAILCDECISLEDEVRELENEIERIDIEIHRLELPLEERGTV